MYCDILESLTKNIVFIAFFFNTKHYGFDEEYVAFETKYLLMGLVW